MLAPAWGFKPLLDISDEEARDQLARASVMVLSYVAQSARGYAAPAVPESEIDKAHTVTERMMIRWRGEPDPKHVRAVDAYFVSAAEHGMNASTFTARVIASTGADVAASLSGAIGAMSGPLHGGAPSRVLHMIEEVENLLEQGFTADRLIYLGLEYKFITQYLLGEMDYVEMKKRLAIAIHQFSKRQLTFFRKLEKDGHVIRWMKIKDL